LRATALRIDNAAVPGTTVFWNATLIDGTGRDPQPSMAVVVEDGRIARVASIDALTPPRDAEVIECDGLALLPGLTDAHVHLGIVRADTMGRQPAAIHALRIAREIESTLDAGYTTVRDAAGIDGAWPHAVRAGLLRGPRILPSGAALSQTGGHGDQRARFDDGEGDRGVPGLFRFSELCDSADAVRRAAREQLRRGATQIKVMASGGVMSPTDEITHTQFTIEELSAAVGVARAAGTYVLAHAYAPPAIANALEAGVHSIEHGNLLDEATAAAMTSRGAWLVPTLVTYQALGRQAGLPENMARKSQEARERGEEAVRIAMAAGVQIGSGSDLLGEAQRYKTTELVLKAKLMGNMAALVSATSANARLFGLEDDFGAIAEGKRADIILTRGNPIDDIALLETPDNVVLVMRDGIVQKRLEF
jgi:imidazolonepropionase-like amidohydrolase